MSRRTLKAEDESGFLMACYDDMVETEALFRVKVKIELKRTSVRGQFRLVATAWKDVGKPLERCVAEWEGQYPTAQASRLYSGVYRAAVGIGAACARAGLHTEPEDSPAT